MPNHVLFAATFAVLSIACSYELPTVPGAGSGGGDASAPAFSLAVEPKANLGAAPAVVRLRIDGAPIGTLPSRVAVVSGELSPALLRELLSGEISMALTKRIVPTIVWSEKNGVIDIAPTAPLAAGQLYSVALEDESLAVSFTVSEKPPAVLPRVWPPAGLAPTSGIGVWCGDKPIQGMHEADVALEPIGAAGHLRAGVEGVDARCVSFEAIAPPRSSAPSGAVPAVPDLEPIVGLDPRPFAKESAPRTIAPLGCMRGEVTFGPGCVRVEDDRLIGRSPNAPVLWAVHGDGVDEVTPSNEGDPFVILGLPSSSDITLSVSAIDTGGRATRSTFTTRTFAPMAHVILNEVLANPIGPEPAEEWVELYNDGSVSADLGGMVLIDLGGETPLPAAKLPPHAYALLVGSDYVESDGFDPVPPPNVILLRVPRVGKSGLSNEGEPLLLRDTQGVTISAFPAAPKPKSGLSVSRVTPGAADGLVSSFALTTPTPGAPNGPAAP